jgi:hypothetical protein
MKEDIAKMLRQAAEYADTHTKDMEPNDDEWSALRDKRFAELVRADEREACAKVCEDKNTLLAWPTYAVAIRARGQA